MRLLHSLLAVFGSLTMSIAASQAIVQEFRSSDGNQILKFAIPPAREEYEGDAPNRKYCIADKRGRLRAWYQLITGHHANQVLESALQGQLPWEFRIKEGEQFTKRVVHIKGRKLIRLIDPTGRYVIHIVESGNDTWIIATWSWGWQQESLRMQYVHAFLAAIPGH